LDAALTGSVSAFSRLKISDLSVTKVHLGSYYRRVTLRKRNIRTLAGTTSAQHRPSTQHRHNIDISQENTGSLGGFLPGLPQIHRC